MNIAMVSSTALPAGHSQPVAPPKSATETSVEAVAPGELEAAAAAAREPVVERESVEQAVSSIQTFVQNIKRDLNFDLDESSGQVVVRVTDASSGEVIRQIPSTEALKLAENLEEARSLLFQAKA